MKIRVIRGRYSLSGVMSVSFNPIFVFIDAIGGQIASIGYDGSKPDHDNLVQKGGMGSGL